MRGIVVGARQRGQRRQAPRPGRARQQQGTPGQGHRGPQDGLRSGRKPCRAVPSSARIRQDGAAEAFQRVAQFARRGSPATAACGRRRRRGGAGRRRSGWRGGGAACTKRSRIHRDLAEMAVDAAEQRVRQMLQFHRHRAGAADRQRAGGQLQRRGDRRRAPGRRWRPSRPAPGPWPASGGGTPDAPTPAPAPPAGAGRRHVAAPCRRRCSLAIPPACLRIAVPLRRTHLLAWYDRHRRRLPWRAEPGEAADPYRVWLSEIMLQQTTVVGRHTLL